MTRGNGRSEDSDRFRLSADRRILFVKAHSTWDGVDARAYFDRLDAALTAMRAQEGFARVLVDATDSSVQSMTTTETINEQTKRVYRQHDRVALLLTSTLLSLQIRRVVSDATVRPFGDEVSALTWLYSKDTP